MSDSRGIFTLRRALRRKKLGEWVSADDVWIAKPSSDAPNHGYIVGGNSPNSVLDKFPFSTETTSDVPGQGYSNTDADSLSNQTHGFFVGGRSPNTAAVTKVAYATDTNEGAIGDTLSSARYGCQTGGNTQFGFVMGGYGGPNYSSSDKITYSTESTELLPSIADLTLPNAFGAMTGNMENGYVTTGWPSYSHVNKITYNIDTALLLPSAFANKSWWSTAFGNGTDGYWAGGQDNGADFYSRIDKIQYSTDTSSYVGNLPRDSNYACSTGDGTAGYIFGGQVNPSNTGMRSDGFKLTYSTENVSPTPSNGNISPGPNAYQNAISARHCGFPVTINPPETRLSDSETAFYENKGYVMGGYPSSMATKMDFTTDTSQGMPGAYLPEARQNVSGMSNEKNAFVMGGRNPGSSQDSSVSKLNYATDTTGYSSGMTAPREQGGNSSSSTHGYVVAGQLSSGTTSTVEKIEYSTQTCSAEPNTANYQNGPMNRGIVGLNYYDSYGYFGGGTSGPDSSLMNRLTYSSSTMDALPSASNLSVGFDVGTGSGGVYTQATAGSDNVGYIAGGYAPSGVGDMSQVTKFTYANETNTLLPSSSFINTGSRYNKGEGNQVNGYFVTGYTGANNKMVYSTETMQLLPSAADIKQNYGGVRGATFVSGQGGGQYSPSIVPVDRTRRNFTTPTRSESLGPTDTVANAANHGYFAGGWDQNTQLSAVAKIQFATDTVAPSPNMTDKRHVTPNSFGNSVHGYIAGGYNGSMYTSSVDKVLYVADLFTVSPSNTPIPMMQSGNLSSPTHGYSVGGYNGWIANQGVISTSIKMSYATETFDFTTNLPRETNRGAATSNQTHGYFAGGYAPAPPPGPVSHTVKIVFATDTFSDSPTASLTNARQYITAFGSTTHGYWGGGYDAGYPPYSSNLDKIDYSSDTKSPIPSANSLTVPVARYKMSTGSATNGYIGGGLNDFTTVIDKYEYSTDTKSSNVAQFPTEQGRGTAISPMDFGLPSSAQIQTMAPNVV